MDTQMIYSIFGVICLFLIAYMTLRAGKPTTQRKSKEEKKLEIVNNYKKALAESLKSLEKNSELRKAKKIMILREYSEELQFNIFFDEDEVRGIISELSGE
ncbi:MAG: hypothetical protein JKY28_02565 [Sulfurimonas sp.]|nr:hypothetical protein [Sulfurimonas sp.]